MMSLTYLSWSIIYLSLQGFPLCKLIATDVVGMVFLFFLLYW